MARGGTGSPEPRGCGTGLRRDAHAALRRLHTHQKRRERRCLAPAGRALPMPRGWQLRLRPGGALGRAGGSRGPGAAAKAELRGLGLCVTETSQHLNCAFPYSETYPSSLDLFNWVLGGTDLKVFTEFFLQSFLPEH